MLVQLCQARLTTVGPGLLSETRVVSNPYSSGLDLSCKSCSHWLLTRIDTLHQALSRLRRRRIALRRSRAETHSGPSPKETT